MPPRRAKATTKAADAAAAAPVAAAAAAPAKRGGKRKVAEIATPTPAAAAAATATPAAAAVEERKTAKVVVKGRAAVDVQVPNHAKYHVYEEGKDVYDVMLNQTNIGQNNNKFYVIQLLQSDSGTEYLTWNRWARVGLVGQSKLQSFGSNLAAAKKDFEAKFHDKTKNRFDARDKFKPVAGKYTLIEIDYAADDPEPVAKKAATASSTGARASSKLAKPVQDLMNLIFDMKMMENQMVELEFDVKKMPLGRLSKKQIKNGYEVLKEIEAAIDNGESGATLAALSSKFYTLIPHNFGMKVPPVIKDKDTLNQKIKMVEALADIEIAATMLKDGSDDGTPAVDTNYSKLKCHIEPIAPTDDDYKLIAEYVKNTYHRGTPPKIVNVFAVERDGEHDRFADVGGKIGNRKLLWHGSRLTNFVGILSQGLRIAPPEAPKSGYRFGKGIYFADMCGLSAMYCRTAGSQDFCMLLADVALGEPAKLTTDQYMEKPLPRTNSTFATGSEAPSSTHTMSLRPPKLGKKKVSLEVEAPLGKPKSTGITSTSVRENQFVVYDVGQAKLQYLLHLRN